MSDESWWSGVAHRDDEVTLGDASGTPAPADRPDEPSLFEPAPGAHRHLAPTVEQPAVDRLTVEQAPVGSANGTSLDEPATEQYDSLTEPATEQYVAGPHVTEQYVAEPYAAEPYVAEPNVQPYVAEPWADGPPAPAPVVLDPAPAVELLPAAPPPAEPGPPAPPQPAPAQPSPDVPALDLPPYEAAPSAVEDDDVPFWLLPAPPRPGAPAPTGAVPVAPAPAPFPDHPVPPLGSGPANGLSPSTPSAPPAQTRSAARGAVTVSRREAGRRGPALSVGAASAGLGARASELLERGTAALGPLGARIRSTHPVILGAAAAFALGLLVVLVSLVTLGGGDDEKPTATRSSARPSASASLAPVDRRTVTASASSVQTAEGKTTYTAANTLDGKPETAWNSNGRKDGAGPGITLTYTFDNVVDLRSITVRNGYIKTVKGQDLFAANARVRALKVTTDTGEFTWTLDDVKSAQSLRKAFGKTKTVTLEIVSIYKGAEYRDVALSEVSFAAAG